MDELVRSHFVAICHQHPSVLRVAKSHVVIVEASNANPMMRLGQEHLSLHFIQKNQLRALVAAHEFRSRFHSKEVVDKHTNI